MARAGARPHWAALWPRRTVRTRSAIAPQHAATHIHATYAHIETAALATASAAPLRRVAFEAPLRLAPPACSVALERSRAEGPRHAAAPASRGAV